MIFVSKENTGEVCNLFAEGDPVPDAWREETEFTIECFM